MEEKKYIIYKHTSPSGKCYIGITCKKPKERWANGVGYTRCPVFMKAIKKYGWENIKHEIIKKNLTLDEANEKEKEYIKLYNTKVPNGYNISDGGGGSYGVTFTKQRKERISKKHKKQVVMLNESKDGFIKYKSLYDAEIATSISKECISQACRNLIYTAGGTIWIFYDDYINLDENELIQLCKSKLYKSKNNRKLASIKVKQYDINANFIQEFSSISDAALSIGKSNISAITACCRHKTRSAYGFIWCYSSEKFDIKNYKNKCIKRVMQFDLNNNLIDTYTSLTEASIFNNIDIRKISKCCIGTQKKSGGYIWKFAE